MIVDLCWLGAVNTTKRFGRSKPSVPDFLVHRTTSLYLFLGSWNQASLAVEAAAITHKTLTAPLTSNGFHPVAAALNSRILLA